MTQIRQSPTFLWSDLLVVLTIASVGVTSCSAARVQSGSESTQAAPESLQAEVSDESNLTDSATGSATEPVSQSVRANAQSRRLPQLIKTANLTLQVEDVNTALDEIRNLLNQQQGDLLKLDSQTPHSNGDRETYRLEIRIPQASFDATLDALEGFGSIQQRSIQSQDVSEQLVDAQARLKNLRKSEETVLKIMERSGSIPDVLSASQELSNIREKIERIDAQFQSLQTQVAFSTINLNLQAETGFTSPATGTGKQLQNAWKRSTQAVGNLTIAFLKLGLWGIAFSPYIIALGLLIWLSQKYVIKGRSKAKVIEAENSSTPS